MTSHDFTAVRHVPMPAGDERPGRHAPAAGAAVVVSSDPGQRLAHSGDLKAVGLEVTTCPGPLGGAFCPALHRDERRCGRVGADTALVVLVGSSRILAGAYARWLPDAEIRIRDARPIQTSQEG